MGGPQSEREKRGETEKETRANGFGRDRRREEDGSSDDVGWVDAIGGKRSAVTDERRDARERTERAAVHAVL